MTGSRVERSLAIASITGKKTNDAANIR